MTPIIEFDGVSKWYGNVIGLNKLTLHIPPGVTGLLGPNGAGKSTLLQLATGQLRPSQGTVRVLGQNVLGQPGAEPRRRPVPGAGRLLRVDDRPRLRADVCSPQRPGPPRRDQGGRPRHGPRRSR